MILEISDYRQVVLAIRDMQVRGAPALGIAAAYGMALAAREFEADDDIKIVHKLESAAKEMIAARPTAVNVAWAVRHLTELASSSFERDIPGRLLARAKEMHQEDISANKNIGKHGANLISDGSAVLTHCNTGALATAGYGTALGVIRAAWETGKRFEVFHTETRPFLQGARLTAWELVNLGIPATMVVDSAAGFVLKEHNIGCVVVGADRIAANGDTANKIGTYTLAVLAKENHVPFYIAAPTSTVDLDLPTGDQIPIEERDPSEVTHLVGVRTAAEGIGIHNPAFDVTPHEYISAIITECGVINEPFTENLASTVSGNTTKRQ